VGSGFGGSILAMIAVRLGLRVMLLERGCHPRFAIGESASPLAGILLEQLSDRYDLPRLRPLAAYGSWQRSYPDLICGLKRGFTFFRHEAGRSYTVAPRRANQLLVAASPSDEESDTHWLRSDVDRFLVDEACALGVDYLDRVLLERVDWQPAGDAVLLGTRLGSSLRLRARFIVDASGPRGFLSRTLPIEDRGFAGYPGTQALFSHFTDVARSDEMVEYGFSTPGEGSRERPPYRPDDAALHHVFDGGWMWVLRFGNGLVSAGAAVEDRLADELRFADGASAWARLLGRYPSIAAQFGEARAIRDFTWMSRVPYRASCAASERWALLPSAAAIVDPLFSTGMPLALLGIERLGLAFERFDDEVAGGRRIRTDEGSWHERYSRLTLREADVTARFVGNSYASFSRFDRFSAYSMFYFAAASYAETARRLSPSRMPGFLCADEARFTAGLDELSPAGCGELDEAAYEDRVATAISEWNLAGLCDPAKQHWYGIDVEDTIAGAHKLGLTPDHVRRALSPEP
jgi:FADH2 O2-dependent halogenase